MKDSAIQNGLSHPCLNTRFEEGIDEYPKKNVLSNIGDKETDEITQCLTEAELGRTIQILDNKVC